MIDASLRSRLPAAAVDYVAEVLRLHPCEVLVVPRRRTKLGDHRPPRRGRPRHRITVNDDLNPYALLTTLLHEVAHAVAWEQGGSRRRWQRPHGPEWQRRFAALVGPLVAGDALPADVREALAAAMREPAAASCSDRRLALALAGYDPPRPGLVRVEELVPGAIFRTDCGTVFRAGPIVRTRRRCFEWRTGTEYRVHGLARVEPLPHVIAESVSGSSRQARRRPGRCAGAFGPRRRRAR